MTFMLDWLWNRSWDSRAGQSPGLLGGRHDAGLDTNMTRKTMLLVVVMIIKLKLNPVTTCDYMYLWDDVAFLTAWHSLVLEINFV